MQFNLTTQEGIRSAMDRLFKWGSVITPLLRVWDLERQKMTAIELIKAGMRNNVGKLEITLSQAANLDFYYGIEGIPIKRKQDNFGALIYEIEGEPIETIYDNNGRVRIRLTLKNVAVETLQAHVHIIDSPSIMNEIFCIRCQSKNLHQLLNGKYKCERCFLIFGASQVKDYLLERLKETEQLACPNVCGGCGRMLSDPNWCAWCGSAPDSLDDKTARLKEHIRAIDKIIDAGKPIEYREASSGDEKAISHCFERAVYHGEWTPLIDLGSAAVDFLINKLSGGSFQEREAAVKALGEMGDVGVLEPLIEAISHNHDSVFKVIDKFRIPPHAFGLLLNKLRQHYPLGSFPIHLKETANFAIFFELCKLFEYSAAEIAESDLFATSQIADVPVDTLGHSHEGPHYLSEIDLMVVHETLDCSALRQAAYGELRRRGIAG